MIIIPTLNLFSHQDIVYNFTITERNFCFPYRDIDLIYICGAQSQQRRIVSTARINGGES